MDTLAQGPCNVAKLIVDGSLDDLVHKRYQRYYIGIVALIEIEKGDFEMLEKKVLEWGEPTVASGKQVSVALNLSHVICDLFCLLALLMVLKFHCLPNLQYYKVVNSIFFGLCNSSFNTFLLEVVQNVDLEEKTDSGLISEGSTMFLEVQMSC